jgi:imidazole glycerol-phosphate synthase subunit HisH
VSPATRPQVVVLDYGSGNLRSAQRALQRAGADVTVTADAEAALNCDGLVVPGVGAFAACMAGLRAIRGEAIIGKRLAGSRPVLGICVGMQVLFAEGAEHGERTAGCGELPGVVERLDAPVLPHMGWNTVRPPAGTRLLAGTGPDTRFYFVHSYAARPLPPGAGAEKAGAGGAADQGAGDEGTAAPGGRTSQPLLTLATHGQDFIAAVEDGPLCATQFHPEKSADAGAAVLANWLELIR